MLKPYIVYINTMKSGYKKSVVAIHRNGYAVLIFNVPVARNGCTGCCKVTNCFSQPKIQQFCLLTSL